MKSLYSIIAASFLLMASSLAVFADTKDNKIAKKAEPEFYPWPNGQPGMMDKKTKEFLESRADNPSQQKLDAMLQQVDRITVDGGPKERFSTKDAEKIKTFKESLKIVEDPKTFGHCMCWGDPQIFLYSGKKQIAHLSCQHGSAIRWNDGWKWDATLKDGSLLTEWLAANGAPRLKRYVEDDRKRAEESERALKKWLAAMPPSMKPYTKEMLDDGFCLNLFILTGGKPGKPEAKAQSSPFSKYWKAIESAYPDKDSRVLALLAWFGSGAGPWSGFPSYEELPEKMLVEIDTKDILHAVQGRSLSKEQLDGTARYFAGWGFRQSKNELSLVPSTLQKALLAHVEKSANQDNIERARAAFKVK